MLTSFGIFWLGEGAGAPWPGADLFILAVIAAVAGMVALSIRSLKVAAAS